MSDYPPVGKELEVLKFINKKAKIINKLEQDYERIQFEDDVHSFKRRDNLHWGITEGHALEGVRCNGTQDTTTLADIILGSRRILDVIPKRKREAVKCFDKLKKILTEIIDLSKDFIICPQCKGEKGKQISLANIPGYVSYASKWEDCNKCNGRGILEK